MPVAPVFGAFGEHHPVLAPEMVAQRVGVVRDGRAVDPHEVGGVPLDHDDAAIRGHGGVVFVEHRTRGGLVAGQIGTQLVQPGAALIERGQRGVHGERVRLGHLVGVQGAPHLVAQHGVWDHHRRRVEARDVERLGRRHAGHRVHRAMLARGGERHVAEARIGQIAVDLVADHRHMMLPAQFADARQGFAIPDVSDRIVWVAQDHQRGLRVGELRLQIRPVDRVMPLAVVDERGFEHPAAVVEDRIEEDVVDRRLDEHVLVRRGELADHAGDRRHHAGAEHQPLRVDGEIMPPAPPVRIGPVPFGRHDRIAEHAVLDATAQRLADLGRGLEIHVRHPHGQRAAGLLPLERIRAGTVDRGIEIVGHVSKHRNPVQAKSNTPAPHGGVRLPCGAGWVGEAGPTPSARSDRAS